MRHQIVIILLCVWGGLTLSAQPVTNEFIRIGDRFLPSLTVEQRKDLVDFYQARKIANTRSRLGDAVLIEQLTDSTLTVRLSEQSRMQVVMLPVDSTYIDMLVFTAEGGMPQSRVSFYNRKGETIASNTLLSPISLADFIHPGTPKDTIDRIQQEVALFTVELMFESVSRSLEAILTIQTNSQEKQSDSSWMPILKKRLSLCWDGVRFVDKAAK